MKRRLDCAWCGRALPAGCRIDKRYCDQRCVELAYYERHPDKRAQKLDKLRGTRTTAGLRTRRTESAPDLVERMEAAHASTRQELEAVQERLAHLEVFLRSQSRASQEQVPSHRSAQDASTARKVAELQAALQVERDRAMKAEHEQTKLQQQLEELSGQLRDPSRDIDSLTISVRQESAQAATPRTELKAVSDLKAKLQAMTERAEQAEHARKEAERQASELRRAVAGWRTHSETQAHQLTETEDALRTAEQRATSAQIQAREESAARLPWTIPSPEHAHRYIPRWEAWDASELDNLPELTDAEVAAIPGQLWKDGERELSQMMRDWINTFSREMRALSQQMYLRIICTPLAERRSEKQKEVLSEAILSDSLQYLRRHQPDIASELERALASDQENYELLARGLVVVCAERKLEKGYS